MELGAQLRHIIISTTYYLSSLRWHSRSSWATGYHDANPMENTVFSGDHSESKNALKSIHDEEVTHQQIRPFSMPIHGKK
eukprot:scaffold6449_cov237-Skeletonema_dohrnii-CCMP3373.AAC.1